MLTLHHNFCPYYSDCVNFNEKNPFDGYFQQMNILSPSSFFGIAFFLFLLFFPLLGHVTLISLLTLTSRLSSCVSSHGLSSISMCKLSCLFALEETLYASLGPPSLAKMNMLMRRGWGRVVVTEGSQVWPVSRKSLMSIIPINGTFTSVFLWKIW